jgi:hypothetical protein
VERVLAREDVELPREQRHGAHRATLAGVERDEAVLEPGCVLLHRVRAARRVVHLLLERIDLRRVSLECVGDLLLEVVDDNEVGEERQDIFNLEQVCVFQEVHGPGAPRARRVSRVGPN